jgi:hypothetical protein
MNQTTDPQDGSAVAEELFTVNLTTEQIDYFWSKVRESEDGCWDWQFALDRKGYGKMAIKYPGTKRNRMLLCHRVAYFLSEGEFPAKLSVLHKCDRPVCCNPDHLFLGTQDDNIQDMMRKGRHNSYSPNRSMGENINTAKLNADQVREIRRLYALGGYTQVRLAAMYGISSASLSALVRGVSWKHLL